MTNIEFPGLGIKFTISKVAIPLNFLGGGIYWYGIIIVLGILLATYICRKEANRLGENPENIYDLILYGLPISIICARIYYVLFSLERYIDDPLSVFSIWEGGIAIYGAVIGAFLTVLIYCKIKKLNKWRYFDLGAYGFLIGQTIGRWGNFINGEAYGTSTDLPWRMVVNGTVAHPTFLYESLWNIIGFLYLWLTRKKKGFDGRTISLYLIWYGLGRFWIEALRTDSLMLGNMRVSRMVSLFAIALGMGIYFMLRKKHRDEIDETLETTENVI